MYGLDVFWGLQKARGHTRRALGRIQCISGSSETFWEVLTLPLRGFLSPIDWSQSAIDMSKCNNVLHY